MLWLARPFSTLVEIRCWICVRSIGGRRESKDCDAIECSCLYYDVDVTR